MDTFLQDIFSFPSILFSFPFIILMVFWLVALLGFIDIEIIDLDGDLETDSDQNGQASWLEKLGLDGAPLTVVLTLLDTYALIFSYLAKKYLLPMMDGIITGAALGTLVAFIALVVAIPFAALSVKPIRRVFQTHEAVRKCDITGTICTVTTLEVNDTFGQAETEDGSMVLAVRADIPNQIKKGERVALISYDQNNDSYWVVTEHELLNQ